MVGFLSALIIVVLVSLAAAMAIKGLRYPDADIRHDMAVPFILLADALMIILEVSSGGNVQIRLLSGIAAALLPFHVLLSSLVEGKDRQRYALWLMLPVYVDIVYLVLCLTGLVEVVPERYHMFSAALFSVSGAAVFVWLMFRRVDDVHAVMMSGTVWASLCLGVDAVCLVFNLSIVLGCSAFIMLTEMYSGLHVMLAVMLLAAELGALGLRVCLGSVFVIRQKREMLIVESMKVSQVECNASNPRADEIYKDIYERVVLHFEMDKPYLDGALTINDVVRVVYSNKVYISRAIGHYTGRNFCQFVNYYRIIYSMDLFRGRPTLKVTELAVMSGFNSTVSYATAFRLFMNETPSEWCRKERTKLLKMKK